MNKGCAPSQLICTDFCLFFTSNIIWTCKIFNYVWLVVLSVMDVCFKGILNVFEECFKGDSYVSFGFFKALLVCFCQKKDTLVHINHCRILCKFT